MQAINGSLRGILYFNSLHLTPEVLLNLHNSE